MTARNGASTPLPGASRERAGLDSLGTFSWAGLEGGAGLAAQCWLRTVWETTLLLPILARHSSCPDTSANGSPRVWVFPTALGQRLILSLSESSHCIQIPAQLLGGKASRPMLLSSGRAPGLGVTGQGSPETPMKQCSQGQALPRTFKCLCSLTQVL
jgi:hypothetical protein